MWVTTVTCNGRKQASTGLRLGSVEKVLSRTAVTSEPTLFYGPVQFLEIVAPSVFVAGSCSITLPIAVSITAACPCTTET